MKLDNLEWVSCTLWDQQKTPEEGQRIHQLTHCEYNNKNDDNSLMNGLNKFVLDPTLFKKEFLLNPTKDCFFSGEFYWGWNVEYCLESNHDFFKFYLKLIFLSSEFSLILVNDILQLSHLINNKKMSGFRHF